LVVWLFGWLVGCLVGWLVGWFVSDKAESCVLTQSVNPSQVASCWVGRLVGWLVGLGRTRLGRVF
jgi:hypothetical protein